MDYLVRRFLIPLHCSLAMKARTKPEFNFCLKVRLDAAMAIFSPEPNQHYARLMVVGESLFREGVRCASTVISLDYNYSEESASRQLSVPRLSISTSSQKLPTGLAVVVDGADSARRDQYQVAYFQLHGFSTS